MPVEGTLSYVTSDAAGTDELVQIDIQTGDVRRTSLSGFPGGQAGYLSVSPDGQRIAYTYSVPDVTTLVVVGADGSDAQEVGRVPQGGYTNIQWAPDRLWLGASPGGLPTVMDLNADNTVRATQGENRPVVFEGDTLQNVRSWTWGDDADELVVAIAQEARQSPPREIHLYRVHTDTREAIEKLTTSSVLAYGVHIAPGGSQMLVTRPDGGGDNEIFLVTDEGATVRPLELPEEVERTLRGGRYARWSDNGRHLYVFTTIEGGREGSETETRDIVGIVDTHHPAPNWTPVELTTDAVYGTPQLRIVSPD